MLRIKGETHKSIQHINMTFTHRNKKHNLPHIRTSSPQHEELPSQYKHEINMIIKSHLCHKWGAPPRRNRHRRSHRGLRLAF